MTSGNNGPRIYQADFLTQLFADPLDPAYAQAAEDRARHGPLPTWRRGLRKSVSVVVLVAIGILLSVAYQQVVRGAPERERVRAGLITRITQQKERNAQLAVDAEALQAEVAALRERAIGDPATIEQLRQLEAAAGMRRVTGDGIAVRLTDGPEAATNRAHRVIDFDLQLATNAMWAFGAEAITINDIRLTSMTAIRRGGQTIYIGDVMVVSPYEIKAIGPPDLYDDFSNSDTARFFRIMQDRPEHRIGFKVSEEDDLTLSAAVMPEMRFATVPTPSASPTPTPSGGGK